MVKQLLSQVSQRINVFKLCMVWNIGSAFCVKLDGSSPTRECEDVYQFLTDHVRALCWWKGHRWFWGKHFGTDSLQTSHRTRHGPNVQWLALSHLPQHKQCLMMSRDPPTWSQHHWSFVNLRVIWTNQGSYYSHLSTEPVATRHSQSHGQLREKPLSMTCEYTFMIGFWLLTVLPHWILIEHDQPWCD